MDAPRTGDLVDTEAPTVVDDAPAVADVAAPAVDGTEVAAPPPVARVDTCRGTVRATLLVGCGLIVLAEPLARAVVRMSPMAFVTTSGGTALGGFAELGARLLRRTGVGLVLGALVALVPLSTWRSLVPPRIRGARRTTALRAAALPALVFLVPCLVFVWLSTPHNMYPTNSRIHWVDYFVDGPRADDFFYAFGQLPHAIFYDHPSLWQGINAGLLSLSVFALLRRLDFSPIASAGLSLLFPFGTLLLLFAETSEDVLLNLLLLTWVVAAMSTRSAVLRGLSIALAITGRPEFVSMIGVYGIVAVHDLWFESSDHTMRWWRSDTMRLHLRALVWAVIGVVASQVLFEVLGHRYMLTNGRLIDLGPLSHLVPLEHDGFTIHPFSGAYVGHFVWVLPMGFLAGTFGMLPTLLRRRAGPALPARHRVVATFCVVAASVSVLLHEKMPTRTYCVRYLAYTYVFVVIGGAIGLRRFAASRPTCGRMVWVAAVVSLLALPVNPLLARERRAARVEQQLVGVADALRRDVDDRRVLVSFGAVSTDNAMSYLFEIPAGRVERVDEADLVALIDDPPQPAVVVARVDQLQEQPDPATVIARTDDLIVFTVG